ncbi:MAG: ribonuclease R [Candidatus Cloacimonetes bacterium]|nr:ribonuclease R [Candidatus Cloacimonadota bacterium]
MYDKKLAYTVKKILEDRPHNHLKIKEIAQFVGLRKHKYKDLIDTLFRLAKDKEINVKNRKYYAIKVKSSKNITGIFDATTLARNKSFAFVKAEPEDIFISSEDTLNAYHNDTVELEVNYQRNGKKHGIITKVIKRANKKVIGTFQEYHGKYYIIPDNSRIHTNFAVNDISTAMNSEKVVLDVTNWGSREYYKIPAGNIVEVLGKAGNPDVEVLSVILQYDLPLEFPQNVLNELDALSDDIPDDIISKRKDLRNLLTFTIDPASAKDFDDAISLVKDEKGFTLYVHIADVAQYIGIKSKLFEEAVKRGNSYYFPKKVIPMLPEKISNKICSLRPFEDKLTLTVQTRYNANYKVISQSVYESVICSNARFNYEEIDEFFEEKKELENDIAETLRDMRKLSASLTKNRVKCGYLKLNIPETIFVFDDEGHVIDLERSKETDSHKMIENFMLVANEYIAKELSSGKTIYRIHEKPDGKRLIKLKEEVTSYNIKMEMHQNLNIVLQNLLNQLPDENYHRVFDRKILRSMKKAKYTVENLGHFGLAMRYYTHFTSPIRRISDLIIHHQIKNKLDSKQTPFSSSHLYKLAKIATEREMIADESEREVDLKNKTIFMKKKVGDEYTAIIIAVQRNAFIVELNRYPVTGIVNISSLNDDNYEHFPQHSRFIGKRKGKIYKLTDTLKVLLSSVDDEIHFKVL